VDTVVDMATRAAVRRAHEEEADVDTPAAAALPLDGRTPAAVEVAFVKARRSELHTRDIELQSVRDGMLREHTAAIARTKQRPETPGARDQEPLESQVSAEAECAGMDLVTAERDMVRAEAAAVQIKLDALVNAPVSGGLDPFEWLPDELLVMVFVMLPVGTLVSGACERVCRRWARLMDSTPVKRRKPEDLWAAYALGSLNQPRTLAGISQHVHLIAVGLDGTICSTSRGGAVAVLRGGNGGRALSRQMLKIDTDEVYALAVGPDGKVYVASHESMLTVWSDTGSRFRTHTQTLHSNSIRSLAVGLDGKIYSGSADNTITVRRPDDFAHLNTLVGHTDAVVALAVGLDGRVYSGSDDRTND